MVGSLREPTLQLRAPRTAQKKAGTLGVPAFVATRRAQRKAMALPEASLTCAVQSFSTWDFTAAGIGT